MGKMKYSILGNNTHDLAWAIMNLDLHQSYEFREGGSKTWHAHVLVSITHGCPSGYGTIEGLSYAFIKVKIK